MRGERPGEGLHGCLRDGGTGCRDRHAWVLMFCLGARQGHWWAVSSSLGPPCCAEPCCLAGTPSWKAPPPTPARLQFPFDPQPRLTRRYHPLLQVGAERTARIQVWALCVCARACAWVSNSITATLDLPSLVPAASWLWCAAFLVPPDLCFLTSHCPALSDICLPSCICLGIWGAHHTVGA